MSPATALDSLAERIASEGEPLAGHLRRPEDDPAFGRLAAAGPRTAAFAREYAFVVEAVREGYLCHYDTPRLLTGADDDLALLAGDLFYAIGINGLAALDDPESVGILSDLIRVAAELRAEDRTEEAEALWLAQLLALSCGKSDELDELTAALERGETGSLESLEGWSAKSADNYRIGRAFDAARKAIDSRSSDR